MITTSARALGTLTAVVILTAAITWPIARSTMKDPARGDTLRSIAALLDENAALVASLKKTEGVEFDTLILSTFLALVRKDGVPKHSDLKQDLDHWMNNNTAIVALLNDYTAHRSADAFRVSAGHYAEYATTLRDRWQSVFEIFMAGGNLPASQGSPPFDFRGAVNAELTRL